MVKKIKGKSKKGLKVKNTVVKHKIYTRPDGKIIGRNVKMDPNDRGRKTIDGDVIKKYLSSIKPEEVEDIVSSLYENSPSFKNGIDLLFEEEEPEE